MQVALERPYRATALVKQKPTSIDAIAGVGKPEPIVADLAWSERTNKTLPTEDLDVVHLLLPGTAPFDQFGQFDALEHISLNVGNVAPSVDQHPDDR